MKRESKRLWTSEPRDTSAQASPVHVTNGENPSSGAYFSTAHWIKRLSRSFHAGHFSASGAAGLAPWKSASARTLRGEVAGLASAEGSAATAEPAIAKAARTAIEHFAFFSDLFIFVLLFARKRLREERGRI